MYIITLAKMYAILIIKYFFPNFKQKLTFLQKLNEKFMEKK